jgi:hypothetical protein
MGVAVDRVLRDQEDPTLGVMVLARTRLDDHFRIVPSALAVLAPIFEARAIGRRRALVAMRAIVLRIEAPLPGVMTVGGRRFVATVIVLLRDHAATVTRPGLAVTMRRARRFVVTAIAQPRGRVAMARLRGPAAMAIRPVHVVTTVIARRFVVMVIVRRRARVARAVIVRRRGPFPSLVG